MAATECGNGTQSEGPLAILAAGGALPIDIAAAVSKRGHPVHVVALAGFADRGIEAFPHDWASLGQVGRVLTSFRRAGCRDLVIAGALQRPNLLRLKVDAGFFRHLPTVIKLTRGGDDSVLRRVVRFFEDEGFRVRGVKDVAPHLLAEAGSLGRQAPDAAAQTAIARASRLIHALGPFDVGQAVVATAGAIVAVEGVRGTDAMLAELGADGCGTGSGRGGVLVKLAKPGQELRVDLPTIGPMTLERSRLAALAGIAIGAYSAIVLDRERVRQAADASGMFVTGIEAGERQATPADVPRWKPADIARLSPLDVLARRAPTPSERRDITIGREIMLTLRREGAGRAAIIAREHVLLVAGALPIAALVHRLADRSHWGLRLLHGRIGTLAVDLAGLDDAGIEEMFGIAEFQAVKEARLAGLVCLGRPIPEHLLRDWAGWANEAGVFLMSEAA